MGVDESSLDKRRWKSTTTCVFNPGRQKSSRTRKTLLPNPMTGSIIYLLRHCSSFILSSPRPSYMQLFIMPIALTVMQRRNTFQCLHVSFALQDLNICGDVDTRICSPASSSESLYYLSLFASRHNGSIFERLSSQHGQEYDGGRRPATRPLSTNKTQLNL